MLFQINKLFVNEIKCLKLTSNKFFKLCKSNFVEVFMVLKMHQNTQNFNVNKIITKFDREKLCLRNRTSIIFLGVMLDNSMTFREVI